MVTFVFPVHPITEANHRQGGARAWIFQPDHLTWCVVVYRRHRLYMDQLNMVFVRLIITRLLHVAAWRVLVSSGKLVGLMPF